MNETSTILDGIRQFFPNAGKDIRSLSPLKLAYLGDAVFEIIIRTLVIERTDGPVKELHLHTSDLVNAGSQARLIQCLLEDLTEDEMKAYRHGRNAKSSSVAKHADIRDYRNATGLEALFGYLYLSGQFSRAVNLCRIGFDKLNIRI